MQIALANLLPDPSPVRRIFDRGADAALLQSLTAAGQIEPILVIPAEAGRFRVVNGNRRLRLAAAANLASLEAHVLPSTDAAHVAGAALAANVLHAPLAPVDQWRSLVAMRSAGHTTASAAAYLGISDRQAERLERLGNLAPEILALVEQYGMPTERFLRTIAGAPLDMQRRAAGTKAILRKLTGGEQTVDWHQLAQLCSRTTYPRSAAIFDLERVKITWQYDALAEPGSPDEWTTADASRFMKAQRQALAAMASDSKGRLAVAEESTRHPGNPELPKGWEPTHGNADKPKRTEVVYATIAEQTGQLVRVTAKDAAAERQAAKERERKEKAKAKANAKPKPGAVPSALGTVEAPIAANPPSDAPAGDPPTDPTPAPEAIAPTAEDAAPLTKEGAKILAALKTKALRARLRGFGTDGDYKDNRDRMLALLILAFHARNVEVRGYEAPDSRHSHHPTKGADILRRLVDPAGHLSYDAAELPRLACETLARVLSASYPDAPTYTPGSGHVAEWTGTAIGAEYKFPPLTTADFLATWKAPALRQAAQLAGVKFSTATQARRDLEGKLDSGEYRAKGFWCPPFAHFGAPGPKPAAED